MNIVLICSNKQRKLMDPVFRNTPHTILANEPAIKGMTVARVLDHHVPHAVVLCDDVLEKEGITRQDMVTLFRAKRPGLRLIYLTAAPNLTLVCISPAVNSGFSPVLTFSIDSVTAWVYWRASLTPGMVRKASL